MGLNKYSKRKSPQEWCTQKTKTTQKNRKMQKSSAKKQWS